MRPSIASAFAGCALATLVIGATVTKPPVPKQDVLKRLPGVKSVTVANSPKAVLLSCDLPVANQGPDVLYKWYSSPSIVTPVWTSLTNTPAMSVTVMMVPGAMYFQVTTYSIFWQIESPPGPVASTPPAPTPAIPSIKLAP